MFDCYAMIEKEWVRAQRTRCQMLGLSRLSMMIVSYVVVGLVMGLGGWGRVERVDAEDSIDVADDGASLTLAEERLDRFLAKSRRFGTVTL